jgi:hypothetical protein
MKSVLGHTALLFDDLARQFSAAWETDMGM